MSQDTLPSPFHIPCLAQYILLSAIITSHMPEWPSLPSLLQPSYYFIFKTRLSSLVIEWVSPGFRGCGAGQRHRARAGEAGVVLFSIIACVFSWGSVRPGSVRSFSAPIALQHARRCVLQPSQGCWSVLSESLCGGTDDMGTLGGAQSHV